MKNLQKAVMTSSSNTKLAINTTSIPVTATSPKPTENNNNLLLPAAIHTNTAQATESISNREDSYNQNNAEVVSASASYH